MTITLTRLAKQATRSCAAFAVLSTISSLACADTSPYTLGITERVQHDSNLFRAQDGGPISADWSSSTGLIGSYNQGIGRETLKANAEVDLVRYLRNDQLNALAHNVGIEGDWSTVGHLSGEWGFTNAQQLYTYNLYSVDAAAVLREPNTLKTNQGFARVHLGVVTRWTIDAILNGLDRNYSAATYAPYDLRRWDATLGTTYQFSPDLSTTVSYRRTKGRYPNFNPNGGDDFTRDDFILGAVYSPSGASTLRLHVSTGQENHSAANTRNSQNWAADAQWIWQATGRTQFTVDFLRDDDNGSTDTPFFAGQLASNDARQRKAVSVGLTYEVTAKINARLTGGYSHRDLDNAFAGQSQFDRIGADRLYTAAFNLDYVPTRNSKLSCGASKEQRTTSGAVPSFTYPYRDTTLSCSGQIAFN